MEKGTYTEQSLRLILEKIPLFLLSAYFILITFHAQAVGKAVISLQGLPYAARIANSLTSYILYIWKMLWPSQLAIYYPYPLMTPLWQSSGAGFLLIILSLLSIKYGKRYPYLPVGWFWYLGTLVPVIGIVQVGLQAMADRFAYVPLIGLYVIITWGGADILMHFRIRKSYLAALAVFVLCLLSITTWVQVRYWENSVTLFKHTLEVTSNNYLIHNNLGATYLNQKQPEKAAKHFKKAIEIHPEYETALFQLGVACSQQNKFDQAKIYFNKVLQCNRHYKSEAHYELGNVYSVQGMQDEAIWHFAASIRINPDFHKAYNNMGIAFIRKKNIAQAIDSFQKAVESNPGDAKSRNNLAKAMAEQNKSEKMDMLH
jgi:tetratricopeptide (TPR) repeat protein